MGLSHSYGKELLSSIWGPLLHSKWRSWFGWVHCSTNSSHVYFKPGSHHLVYQKTCERKTFFRVKILSFLRELHTRPFGSQPNNPWREVLSFELTFEWSWIHGLEAAKRLLTSQILIFIHFHSLLPLRWASLLNSWRKTHLSVHILFVCSLHSHPPKVSFYSVNQQV